MHIDCTEYMNIKVIPLMTISPISPSVETQLLFLETDQCILVNKSDVPIGSASKKTCHLMSTEQMTKTSFDFACYDDWPSLLILI